MSKKTVNVFVYGTLRKGNYNHYLISEAEYLGKGRVKGKMYDCISYPKAVLSDTDEHSFVVEGYKVSKKLEKELDDLEFPYGYKKKSLTIEIESPDGEKSEVKGIIYHVLPESDIYGNLRENMIIEDWLTQRRRK
jgi:gamma-glutamylcyclotransferase (GGCT)/AIG2-like uncharacterized protein YtfP